MTGSKPAALPTWLYPNTNSYRYRSCFSAFMSGDVLQLRAMKPVQPCGNWASILAPFSKEATGANTADPVPLIWLTPTCSLSQTNDACISGYRVVTTVSQSFLKEGCCTPSKSGANLMIGEFLVNSLWWKMV